MTDWFAGPDGQGFVTAIIWTLAALILLVIVLVVVRLIRSMTFGTFVAGGRNRKTRLAVMDATAVDSHRRLVLVRRDDIEHLLLIGGPTDVVVEREIRMAPGRRTQSVFGNDGEFEAQNQAPVLPPLPTAPQAPPRQRAPEPAQLPSSQFRNNNSSPPRQPERPAQSVRHSERVPAAPPRPVRQTGARPPARDPAPLARSNPSRQSPASSGAATSNSNGLPNRQPSNNLDDALLRELEVTFDADPPPSSYDTRPATSSSYDTRPPYDTRPSASSFDPGTPKPAQQPVEMTLDDEMTKLLGELSNNKR